MILKRLRSRDSVFNFKASKKQKCIPFTRSTPACNVGEGERDVFCIFCIAFVVFILYYFFVLSFFVLLFCIVFLYCLFFYCFFVLFFCIVFFCIAFLYCFLYCFLIAFFVLFFCISFFGLFYFALFFFIAFFVLLSSVKVREQFNGITAFLDMSAIYASDEKWQKAMRQTEFHVKTCLCESKRCIKKRLSRRCPGTLKVILNKNR